MLLSEHLFSHCTLEWKWIILGRICFWDEKMMLLSCRRYSKLELAKFFNPLVIDLPARRKFAIATGLPGFGNPAYQTNTATATGPHESCWSEYCCICQATLHILASDLNPHGFTIQGFLVNYVYLVRKTASHHKS